MTICDLARYRVICISKGAFYSIRHEKNVKNCGYGGCCDT